MKKICLVYPKSMSLPKYFDYATNITTDVEETLPPLGMLYLISNSKYQIDLIDNRTHKFDSETLFKKLMTYDIVGFGGTIFEIKEARKLSLQLMEEGIITIYGGPNATANWNLYLNLFNIIVRGEGEEILDKIIDNTQNLESIGFMHVGLTYVNQNIFRIKNLDGLTFPDRSKININDYKRKETAYLKGVYPVDTVVSSRGCPFDCYFCSSKLIWERKYTFRSVDNILSEIKFMFETYNTKGIYFREDNFTLRRDRVVEFCEKITDFDISWLCESRVDTLDEKLIELMAKSGCKGIWFGIESTDDNVLKKIGKGVSFDQIKTTIDLCNKYNIRSGGGFMLGFPFEDRKSIEKNFTESKKLNLSIRFYNRVWAIPVSKMYYEVVNKKLDYYSFENIILPSTEYLTADEVNKLYFQLVSQKEIFEKKISRSLGKRNIDYLKEKFPKAVEFYRKILNTIYS